jgi:hypothetical protein
MHFYYLTQFLIAIMLQFVRPARTDWRLLGDGWLTRMNESGGRIHGLPRALRTRHNMLPI